MLRYSRHNFDCFRIIFNTANALAFDREAEIIRQIQSSEHDSSARKEHERPYQLLRDQNMELFREGQRTERVMTGKLNEMKEELRVLREANKRDTDVGKKA